jgi:hypothetical protein
MMQVDFSGWFQCRLATDPDPTDEPRGVSGWTYALAGEPDLDRIVRTQPAGTTPRMCGPDIGVRIEQVTIDGRPAPHHALEGARLNLLSGPAFEGRNGIASEDTEEPIFPFHLCIETAAVRLEREFRDLDTREWRFQKSNGAEANFAALTKAGIADPAAYVADRRSALERHLAQAATPLERLQLQTRLRHLAARGFGPVPMFVGLRYRYRLEGPWFRISDDGGALAGTIDSSPWLFDGWVGAWDADALCGFMTGNVLLPFRADRTASGR